MLKEIGIVVAYEKGIVTVVCQRQSGCVACSAKSQCGTQALGQLTGDKDVHFFTMSSLMPLTIGQRVEIGLPKKSFLLSGLLVYFLPLCVLLLATLFSQSLTESLQAVVVLSSTLGSFFFLQFFSRQLQHHPHFQPILLRLL